MKYFLFFLLAAATFISCKDDESGSAPLAESLYSRCPNVSLLPAINSNWKVSEVSPLLNISPFTIFDIEFGGGLFALIGDRKGIWRYNLDDFSTEQLSSSIGPPAIICAPDAVNIFVFTDLSLPDDFGFAKDDLFHSGDAGETWESLSFPDTLRVYDAHFSDSQKGFAIIAQQGESHLWSTDDGGRTWSEHDSLTTQKSLDLNSIFFVNNETGFVLGDGFNFYKTTNGGGHWERLTTTENDLHSIQFIDETSGFALGKGIDNPDSGNLLKTSDGGLTWAKILEGQVKNYHFFDDKTGVAFISKYACLPVHNAGIALSVLTETKTTTDGGLTWQDGPNHTATALSSMHFWSPAEGVRLDITEAYKLEYQP